jgi:Eukaryotic DNA topoisomerase I, catalytic core
VFRTYNASVTLDRLLTEQEQEQTEAAEAAEGTRQRLESPTVDKRKADYDRANKEVRHVTTNF